MEGAAVPAVILVVEDEMLLRMVVADCLADSGYEVVEAANVDQARAVLSAAPRKIDLVFTDIQMPGGEDGFDLAAWLHIHDPEVPVIFTSGWAEAADRARDLGHQGPIVLKPYEQAVVLGLVQERLRDAGRSG